MLTQSIPLFSSFQFHVINFILIFSRVPRQLGTVCFCLFDQRLHRSRSDQANTRNTAGNFRKDVNALDFYLLHTLQQRHSEQGILIPATRQVKEEEAGS